MEEIIKNSSEFGLNCQTVFIGGEAFIINNPSVKAVSEACKCVSLMCKDEGTTSAVQIMSNASLLAEGMSWLIEGDGSLKDKLAECPLLDIVTAWAEAISIVLPNSGLPFVRELVKFSKSVTNQNKSE